MKRHSPPRPGDLLRLMRPKHYLKNLLIFVSITFDRNLFHSSILLRALLGFAAFCLLTSAVYVFNDVRDVEADRRHEIKRRRPILFGGADHRAQAGRCGRHPGGRADSGAVSGKL